jgi:hypothetical protein
MRGEIAKLCFFVYPALAGIQHAVAAVVDRNVGVYWIIRFRG